MSSPPNNFALILTPELSLETAIKAMEKEGTGYLAFINTEGRLVGILTDADIRKAFLKKEFELSKIINKKPRVLPYDVSKEKIIASLKRIRRRHMPLVGENGIYKGVFCLDTLDFNTKDNWVVIMAGGLGSRMGDLTKNTPKPMLEVAGKPVLEHILDSFISKGFFNFLISVNYKKEVIKNYFQDGFSRGINIHYVEEIMRLGTAGALGLINFEITKPIIVTNGDILTHLDYEDLIESHYKSNSLATMCVREETYKIPYGTVDFNPSLDILSFKEKPEISLYINAGVYLISHKLLPLVPKNAPLDMPDFFELIRNSGFTTKAYLLKDYWIDIGFKEQFQQANAEFKKT